MKKAKGWSIQRASRLFHYINQLPPTHDRQTLNRTTWQSLEGDLLFELLDRCQSSLRALRRFSRTNWINQINDPFGISEYLKAVTLGPARFYHNHLEEIREKNEELKEIFHWIGHFDLGLAVLKIRKSYAEQISIPKHSPEPFYNTWPTTKPYSPPPTTSKS